MRVYLLEVVLVQFGVRFVQFHLFCRDELAGAGGAEVEDGQLLHLFLPLFGQLFRLSPSALLLVEFLSHWLVPFYLQLSLLFELLHSDRRTGLFLFDLSLPLPMVVIVLLLRTLSYLAFSLAGFVGQRFEVVVVGLVARVHH